MSSQLATDAEVHCIKNDTMFFMKYFGIMRSPFSTMEEVARWMLSWQFELQLRSFEDLLTYQGIRDEVFYWYRVDDEEHPSTWTNRLRDFKAL